MPRLARKYLESNYCHIIVQGIDREYIFKKNNLKNAYKNILRKNLSETTVKILAYCIMDNHAHMLVHFDKISEMTKLMQKTNTCFAKLYNNLNKRVGYVFRDRYYTQMILTENQLYNCIAYIHENPIKANIVNNKENYEYSSYNEYIGTKDLIVDESIKLAFGTTKNYIEIFNEIHNKEDIEDIIDIKEEIKDSSQIIQTYLKEKSKNIKEIIEDEYEFCELLLNLRHYGGLSLREMSKIFGVNKDKLNRIINKKM